MISIPKKKEILVAVFKKSVLISLVFENHRLGSEGGKNTFRSSLQEHYSNFPKCCVQSTCLWWSESDNKSTSYQRYIDTLDLYDNQLGYEGGKN